MYLGVDIGGSHISAALFDGASFSLIRDSYTSLKAAHDLPKDQLLNQWSTFINQVISDHKILGIGIALPGSFDYKKGIALYDQDKFTQLYGLDLKAYFLNSLHISSKTQISFINDAESFAYGEYGFGALKNAKRAIILTLGTGLGASFVVDGNCLKEGKGIPNGGELYHLPFNGKRADDWFSTRGIIERYFLISGHKVNGAKEVADLAYDLNHAAIQTFNNFGKELGSFLNPFINTVQIDTLVLGGNIAKALPLFESSLLTSIENNVTLKTAQLEHLAPLYGAVYSYQKEKS